MSKETRGEMGEKGRVLTVNAEENLRRPERRQGGGIRKGLTATETARNGSMPTYQRGFA